MAAETGIAVWAFWVACGLIVYTYAGYPLVITLLARLPIRRLKSVVRDLPDSLLPSAAMVVAAYNEGETIAQKLENTWQIDYPCDRFALYVGSDGSSDETNAILRSCSHPQLNRYLFTERRGKVSVVNDLVNEVDAEIVIMSDASTLFKPDAVRKLVAHFADPRVGCVTGELSIDQDGGASGEGLYLKFERWIKRSEGRLGCVIGCVGAIFAIRKSAYEALPPSTIVEDFVICLRALEKGFLARSEPHAQAVDPPCTTNRGEMSRKTRIGAGGFQALGLNRGLLHPRHGIKAFAFWGHKVLRWLAPCFLIVALLANIGLAFRPFYEVLLAAQVGAILIAALAYRAGPERPLPRWTRPISYFYLMHYALFCGFIRYLRREQKVTWERAATLSRSQPSAPVARETAPVSD